MSERIYVDITVLLSIGIQVLNQCFFCVQGARLGPRAVARGAVGAVGLGPAVARR